MLIYAGIDEAGYGPMLGPLCVGLSVFRVADWSTGDAAPDLWDRLSPAVCRNPAEARRSGSIPFADSKRLKLANQSKTRHPLTHLERGVLTMLSSRPGEHKPIHTDLDLFEAVGVATPGMPWYAGDPVGLPLGNDARLLSVDASRLGASLAHAGIELIALRVIMMDEQAYNRMLGETRSKAAVVERALEQQIRATQSLVEPGDTLRIVADRQSGRQRYGGLLNRCFGSVRALEESERASRYALDGEHGMILHSQAEDAHLPVALASMAAKLARELAMNRFNRYWCQRVPELKPTAGYVQDARRWLNDAHEHITREERGMLVRLA